MTTAIDKIKQAEQQASDIRAEALQKSREDLRAAGERISAEQKEKIAQARHKFRSELEDAEKKMAQKQSQIAQENNKAKEEFKSSAQSGVSKAADIIVKGILGN